MTSADRSYDRLAGRQISRCETHSGLCDRLKYADHARHLAVDAHDGGNGDGAIRAKINARRAADMHAGGGH